MSVIYDKILGKLRDGAGSGGGGSSMPAGGPPVEELTSPTITASGKDYVMALTDDTTFTFFTPVEGSPNAFRLTLAQPSTPVAVVFPTGIWWGVKNNFASDNPAPTMSVGNTIYGFTFEWDETVEHFLGNLSYVIRLS